MGERTNKGRRLSRLRPTIRVNVIGSVGMSHPELFKLVSPGLVKTTSTMACFFALGTNPSVSLLTLHPVRPCVAQTGFSSFYGDLCARAGPHNLNPHWANSCSLRAGAQDNGWRQRCYHNTSSPCVLRRRSRFPSGAARISSWL